MERIKLSAINIGSRQRGRLRGENVLDAEYDTGSVYEALRRALYDEDFRSRCRNTSNPYGTGNAGRRIAEIVATVPLGPRLIQKGMTLAGEASDGWFR